MRDLQISIRNAKTNFAPGDTLAGQASWQLDQAADAIELRLFWYTEGKGTRNTAVASVQRIDSPQKTGELAFDFLLPDGPHSFSGKLISLIWALELVALPSDESQRVNIVVSPTRAEINLYAQSSSTENA